MTAIKQQRFVFVRGRKFLVLRRSGSVMHLAGKLKRSRGQNWHECRIDSDGGEPHFDDAECDTTVGGWTIGVIFSSGGIFDKLTDKHFIGRFSCYTIPTIKMLSNRNIYIPQQPSHCLFLLRSLKHTLPIWQWREF